MLWTSSLIKGFAVTTSDGRLGTVSDFLFDDATWLVRWLVVDTGSWLPGRKVLLPPSRYWVTSIRRTVSSRSDLPGSR